MKGMRVTRIGVSPVISTVMLTATLLVILTVASYFAINILEIQVQSSEFEQAKTAMMVLDKTIADVALRQGAVSSVPFNQRSGGIGIYEGGTINITILASNQNIRLPPTNSYVIKYRGGSMVTAAEVNLTRPCGLIVTDVSKPLGYVRVEVENGAWIVLDYNRVRATLSPDPTNPNLRILDVQLIRLVPGNTWGSGTVTVRVQNVSTNVTAEYLLYPGPVEIHVEVDGKSERYLVQNPISAVRFTVITILVSIM